MAELMVVATPIGNLQDLSPRMADALASCDLIAAEDTRVTMKLLHHLNLKKPMTALHRHNEHQLAGALARRILEEDLTVCLTCDAGTPGISDPGIPLVKEAISLGIRVTPVAGPTAVTTHLSASGFDARAFAFYGFPPREKKALREALHAAHLSKIPVAAFYESPHRVVDLVAEIARAFPDAPVSVACDLTKRYELILTGPVADVLDKLRANPNVEKGEYSVLIDLTDVPAIEAEAGMPAEARLLLAMMDGAKLPDAVDAAIAGGAKRNDVYRAKLRVKEFLDGLDI